MTREDELETQLAYKDKFIQDLEKRIKDLEANLRMQMQSQKKSTEQDVTALISIYFIYTTGKLRVRSH